VTFSRVDAIALYRDRTYDLTTSYLRNGAVELMGYLNLHRFHLEGTIPVWQWRLGDALLEQRRLLAWEATGDGQLLADLYPVLTEITTWHQRGTRYNIHVAEDGLLASGTAGTQLTWMDVKIGEEVPTPRHGKAVELSALWYNTMRWMTRLAATQGQDDNMWQTQADRTRLAFDRF